MEYRVVRDLSIYNLIAAGASMKLISDFEVETGLKVLAIMPLKLDVESRILKWAKKKKHINWLVDNGFVEQVVELAFKAGQRFTVLRARAHIGSYLQGAVNCIIDEVVLLGRAKGCMKLVSLRTGVIGEGSCKCAKDGTITEEQVARLVEEQYGVMACVVTAIQV